jgi:hypothetical protein
MNMIHILRPGNAGRSDGNAGVARSRELRARATMTSMMPKVNSSPVVSDSSVVRPLGRKMCAVSGAIVALLPV